jgi:hypothetical protein
MMELLDDSGSATSGVEMTHSSINVCVFVKYVWIVSFQSNDSCHSGTVYASLTSSHTWLIIIVIPFYQLIGVRGGYPFQLY